jgi:hypothetical protein
MRALLTLLVFVWAGVAVAAPPVFKEEKIQGPGFEARILTWTDGDETDKLIGGREWAIMDGPSNEMYLYIGVSTDELRMVKNRLFGKRLVGWPWATAMREGLVVSVWYDRQPAPFYALRADKFRELKAEISTIHKGKLPASIVRGK